MSQLSLFSLPVREQYAIATTPEVDQYLSHNSPVAIGISGGKDSSAAAKATIDYLDRIGHTGPRLLIHSDLGRTEWKASIDICQRLSDQLKTELVVVRREKGDMMDRWLQRWSDNVDRYTSLSCVMLILPWSTPSMRFCTSELKTAIISRELVNRYPDSTILSVTGIRREESSNRAKMPVAKPQTSLTSKTNNTTGLAWNPIIDWELDSEVWPYHEQHGLPIHEAYTKYGASRVSCAFCIMSTPPDILAALGDERNHDLYREMVDLEIVSTFSFQKNWLADARPDLLSSGARHAMPQIKRMAAKRDEYEARIPKHLHYTKGWPTCIPTQSEAELLADVRQRVGRLMGFQMQFTEPGEIIERYEYLFALARAKETISQKLVSITAP